MLIQQETSNQNVHRRSTIQIIFYYIDATRSNYYWTYQENGCIVCGWKFSIVGLVHENMNIKKRVLL